MDRKENISKFCRGQRNISTTIMAGIKNLFERMQEKPAQRGQGKE